MNAGPTNDDIGWYEGPRAALRRLFELADDSGRQIDSYIHLGRVLVARDPQERIIGYLQLLPTSAGEVELKSMAVREDQQRRGIGRRLVQRAVAICRDEGTRAVTVSTATADIENIGFYQRCGFRVSSVGRDAFTEALGYPAGLEANGIPVRDSITFTLLLA